MSEYAFSDSSHLSWEELKVGDVLWVKVRARGAETSYLTPQEAARIGQEWVKRYGSAAHD